VRESLTPESLPEPQPVVTPLTEAAIFLVVTVNPGGEEAARQLLADVAGICRAVGFRIPRAGLDCVVGIGSQAWDRLFAGPRPAELHPFRELAGPRHRAPATPGDLLFHVRADRMDLCFEFAAQVMARLAGAVTVADEVHGFRYFGRRKLTDIELPDDVKPPNSHVALNTLTGPDGEQLQIVRANMPFGDVGRGEFGTYFIGYAASVAITEQMLTNMFIGRPPGTTDRVLDFSTAVTGGLFFAPSADFLDNLPAAPDSGTELAPGTPSGGTGSPAPGSLGIGSLKGRP
jgi:putative iron-dependent peroxidase